MAVVLKTTEPETVPGVRIPLPPPSPRFARFGGESRLQARRGSRRSPRAGSNPLFSGRLRCARVWRREWASGARRDALALVASGHESVILRTPALRSGLAARGCRHAATRWCSLRAGSNPLFSGRLRCARVWRREWASGPRRDALALVASGHESVILRTPRCARIWRREWAAGTPRLAGARCERARIRYSPDARAALGSVGESGLQARRDSLSLVASGHESLVSASFLAALGDGGESGPQARRDSLRQTN